MVWILGYIMIISILAGGIGSRFWPMSTPEHPKQFIDFAQGSSLFSLTLQRVMPIVSKDILVITQKRYQKFLKNYENITPLFEPRSRNTLGAVLLTAKYLFEQNMGKEPIVFLPADHLITNVEIFQRDIMYGAQLAKNMETMLVLGIEPTTPETGYGYIRAARLVDSNMDLYGVKAFKEKPGEKLAQYYLMSKKYFWNCGILITTPEVIAKELLNLGYEELYNSLIDDNYEEWIKKFDQIPDISTEYAILEKSRNIAMLKAHFDWSDVGNWPAYFDAMKHTQNKDHVVKLNSENNDILTDKKTILIDIEDLIVVDSKDGLLIMKKGSDQRLKIAFQMMKEVKK